MSDRYTFTADQLARLLGDAIELYLEYQAQHGKAEEDARRAAVAECFEALDSEPELVGDGLPPFLRTLDTDIDELGKDADE